MNKKDKRLHNLYGTADYLLTKTSRSFHDIFSMATGLYPRDTAVIYQKENGRFTKYNYEEYKSQTYLIAGKLAQLTNNIPSGETVALKVNNSPEWCHLFWAILMNGFRVFLIGAKLAKENTEHILKNGNAKAIITDDGNKYKIETITLEKIESQKPNYRFAESWADEVIFCSSGTTGEVKLMVYNGTNMSNQVAASLCMPDQTKTLMYPSKAGDLRILAMIPFHHIFGFVGVFLWYTFYGKSLVFVESKASNEILKACRDIGVTHLFHVPLFWDAIANNVTRKIDLLEDQKKKDRFDKIIAYNTHKISRFRAGVSATKKATRIIQKDILGSNIKFCISGGGYLSEKTQNIINGIGYPLYNGYGMTELGVTSVELSPRVGLRLRGSIGKPLYGITYEIRASETNNKVGELYVKSPITHFAEIVNGVEKPANLTEDGFFATGDIVEKDPTGRYYIKGRIKDVIINSNGENIYPDEVESYFKKVPHAKNVCVFGARQGTSNNEDIVLVIEPDKVLSEAEHEELKKNIKEINESLVPGMQITKFLISSEPLPLAGNMKVKRVAVKELYNKKADSLTDSNKKQKVEHFKGMDMAKVQPYIVRMQKVFSNILYIKPEEIDPDGHWINDLGGDSMSYIQLVGDIEKEFEVTIKEEQYGAFTCVNDFVEEVLHQKPLK